MATFWKSLDQDLQIHTFPAQGLRMVEISLDLSISLFGVGYFYTVVLSLTLKYQLGSITEETFSLIHIVGSNGKIIEKSSPILSHSFKGVK